MAKRVYFETIKKWLIGAGITVGTLVGGLFIYLIFLGAIEITGYSGDVVCEGTIEDPCYAYINLTAKEDIFIYPVGYDPWGRDTLIEFDPAVKSWKLQRSWGSGWRDIPLNKTCTGTWCGAPNNKGVSYSYVLREGRDYQFRIVGYKNSPYEDVKGAINYEDKEYLDPTWKGIQELKGGQSTLTKIPKEEYIRVTDKEGFDENLNWSFRKINDTQWIATFKVKGNIYDSIKECQEMIYIKDKELCAKNRANELFGKEKEIEYGNAIAQLDKYPRIELTERIEVSEVKFNEEKGEGEYILNFPDGFHDGEKIKIGLNSTTIMASATDPFIGWESSSRYQYSCRGENARIHVIFQYPAEAIYYVYSDDNGYNWVNPVNFTSATDMYDMNMDCYDENITIAYSDQSGTDRMIVNFSNDNGETWSGMPPVSNTNVFLPHCLQRGGELVCAYGENSGDEYDLCYSRNMSGWENCQVIVDNEAAQAFLVDIVYYPDLWFGEIERGVFLKLGTSNYMKLYRGNYTNTTFLLQDGGVDSWNFIGDPDRPGVFYIVEDRDGSTVGSFMYSMDNASSWTNLGTFDSDCGSGIGQIRDEPGGDRAYVEIFCTDASEDKLYSFTWAGTAADPTDKTLRYTGTDLDVLPGVNGDGRNSDDFVDVLFFDLIAGEYNVIWLTYHFNDSQIPEYSNEWDDSNNYTTSGIGNFNVTVNMTNGTVYLYVNNTAILATNLTADVYNASYSFTAPGTYAYYWYSWGDGSNSIYSESGSRNYIIKSNYTFSILDPTTGSPDSVTYPENITLTFLLDKDGANVTSGISVNNITIGGVQASVLFPGEASTTSIDFEAFEGQAELYEGDFNNWTQADFDTAGEAWGAYTGNGQSGSTGPTANYDNYYVMVETSSGQCNDPDTAVIYRSPAIDFDIYDVVNVSFARHMYGRTMGTLHIKENSTGAWLSMWNLSGNQGDAWVVEEATITGKSGVGNIAIWLDCGASYTSDAAVDSVNITGYATGTSEFAWVAGTGWQANVSIPNFASGTKDLIINVSYASIDHYSTETNAISYGVADTEYPLFSNYWDDNASLLDSGDGHFNVTVTSTNGTVLLAIDGNNITATNLTADVYNATYTFSSGGAYTYYWHSWGNGSSSNFNSSTAQSYTINATVPYLDWSQNQTNSTRAGENVLFSVFWNSSTNLSSYIFGWWNGANWTQTNYSGDKESGEQTFSGEVGSLANWTSRKCDDTWGVTNEDGTDYTMDACAAADHFADEHVEYIQVNATTVEYGTTINATVYVHCYGTADDISISYNNGSGTWVNKFCGACGGAGQYYYSTTFIVDSVEGEHWIRGSQGYNKGCPYTCADGQDSDNDDVNITVIATGGGDDVDANKTAVEYLNVFSGNVYEQIDNLTIISYVSYYNTSGSVNNGNANATLWLEVYNGSDWIDEGDFSVTGTGNFSKVITTTSILAAWQTDANRDIKISARLMDYNSSSLFDTINWTEVWIDIFSEADFLMNDSAVEFSGLTNHSNVTKQITSSVGATIKWQIWANDTGSQTNITEIFQFTTTSGAADTCTCPGAGNNWEVDMEDNCNLTVACTLTTGNLSWIGSSGYFNCSANLNLTNRDAPPSSTIFYWSSGCDVRRE